MTAAQTAIPGAIGALLFLGVLVVGLVLVAIRVRGRARPLALAGVAGVLLSTVLQTISAYLVPAMVDRANVILAIHLSSLFTTLVELAGIALLIGAVIVASTSKPAPPGPAGPAGPAGNARWGPSPPGPRLR